MTEDREVEHDLESVDESPHERGRASKELIREDRGSNRPLNSDVGATSNSLYNLVLFF